MNIVPHRYPAGLPAESEVFRVHAGRHALDVRAHAAAHFASFECDGPVEVELEGAGPAVIVRPLRHGVAAEPHGDKVRFRLPGPGHWQVESPGRPLLYLYALPPAPPVPAGEHVRRFAGGRVHEAGRIDVRDGEVVWLEPGAVVIGCVRAERARGFRIGGTGLLVADTAMEPPRRRQNVRLVHCAEFTVEDLLMTAERHWMILLAGCSDARVRGVRQIAAGLGTDGVDVVGSQRIAIEGCCLHNGDDNVALKAIAHEPSADRPWPEERWDEPVEDVAVRGCSCYNTQGGSSMEIGYETRTARIARVVFEDIDVLGVHQFGSVFGIHNGDRAVVEDVLWRDVRVEHHYDKLIDFRVLISRWNHDAERGRIRRVTLRDIEVAQSIYNPGYTLSVMAGFDAAHPVEDVRLENFRLGGRVVRSADHLDLVTRHAQGIVFG